MEQLMELLITLLYSRLHPSMVVVSVSMRIALNSEPLLSTTASPKLLPLEVTDSVRLQTS